ncbi:hypothetical protein SBRCBS47491_005417 [Sporothrix bragantina]|uniref:Uncharacterized protein n=1 Tax=Sporothrix bragantina TaxID=671064 RepID=A0ABP0BWA3_9PEZI
MKAVYSRASCVTVLLGPADAETDAVMDALGVVAADKVLDPNLINIYACLAILPPEERAAIAPDFSKSVEEVCTAMAQHVLSTLDQPLTSMFSFEKHTSPEILDWPS